MAKEFLTYDQQMRHLKEDKKIVCESINDKIILGRNGYFNLINGYKRPFVQTTDQNGNHVYIGGTTVEQIYEAKKFDEELKMHLLKYITKVEEEVRP